jgi:hypothetical protein
MRVCRRRPAGPPIRTENGRRRRPLEDRGIDRTDFPVPGRASLRRSAVVAAIWELRDRARSPALAETIIAWVDREGMTSMTGNVTVPSVQAVDLRFCAPGRTRTCNLRIRSKTRPVCPVTPESIAAGRVRVSVRAVASRAAL